jgi:hypothetical protein
MHARFRIARIGLLAGRSAASQSAPFAQIFLLFEEESCAKAERRDVARRG